VKYWLHVAHLLVEGKKMAKSLGNFFTLRDLLGKGFTGREIRCLLLSAHYRAPFNFTIENLQGARTSLARVDECAAKLRELAGSVEGQPDAALVTAFTEAMDDDLNVSACWGRLFEWIRETNRLLDAGQVSATQAQAALAGLRAIDSVLGVLETREIAPPSEIVALLGERETARKARDFKRADALRAELKQHGWVIEDTPKGPRLKHT
jgi:cysteinyl-tRNA synthetase